MSAKYGANRTETLWSKTGKTDSERLEREQCLVKTVGEYKSAQGVEEEELMRGVDGEEKENSKYKREGEERTPNNVPINTRVCLNHLLSVKSPLSLIGKQNLTFVKSKISLPQ